MFVHFVVLSINYLLMCTMLKIRTLSSFLTCSLFPRDLGSRNLPYAIINFLSVLCLSHLQHSIA